MDSHSALLVCCALPGSTCSRAPLLLSLRCVVLLCAPALLPAYRAERRIHYAEHGARIHYVIRIILNT